MAISDVVARNLTTIFVGLMACFETYGFVSGRSFSGGCLLIVSTAAVILVLVATLTWDVSRKATCAFHRDHAVSQEDVCKGGICWHGVAPRSPASQEIKCRDDGDRSYDGRLGGSGGGYDDGGYDRGGGYSVVAPTIVGALGRRGRGINDVVVRERKGEERGGGSGKRIKIIEKDESL